MTGLSSQFISSRNSRSELQRLEISLSAADEGYRLQIESKINEIGLLFRLCAVLFRHNWYILQARIFSPDEHSICDEFLIRPQDEKHVIDNALMRLMATDLESLLFDNVSVLEYLNENHREDKALLRESNRSHHQEVSIDTSDNRVVIEIRSQDRSGLLLEISQAFYLMNINILEAKIQTKSDGHIHNIFYVDPADQRFAHQEFQRRLTEELGLML
ncbi:MAG: ACT domain-containing protein [Leptospiraceae bacterium]|nr:ACT domain-containing protein [Leptospiraceae bacterium]